MVFYLIQIDSKDLSVGRAALSNLLGGVGYFYGQSKIALPKGFTVSFRASHDINSILLVCFLVLRNNYLRVLLFLLLAMC